MTWIHMYLRESYIRRSLALYRLFTKILVINRHRTNSTQHNASSRNPWRQIRSSWMIVNGVGRRSLTNRDVLDIRLQIIRGSLVALWRGIRQSICVRNVDQIRIYTNYCQASYPKNRSYDKPAQSCCCWSSNTREHARQCPYDICQGEWHCPRREK